MGSKPVNWSDQFWHFICCFGFTLITVGSWAGFLVVILWAITREYYQTKARMLEVAREHGKEYSITFGLITEYMWSTNKAHEKENDFFKRDLKFSYGGVAVALLIIIPLKIWVL